MLLTVKSLSVNFFCLGRPITNPAEIRLLLRISIRKLNLRRTIWFLVNRSLCITFSPLSLDGCIIQSCALMLIICFVVVASLWIMHPDISIFGMKLHSVPMRLFRISCSTNAIRPTLEFTFRRTIIIIVCSTLRILWMHELKRTNTFALLDLVLLIRMEFTNVESKRLSKWTALHWFILQYAVPRVLSLMNCGPWNLITLCGCRIKCLVRIMECPNMNSGAAPTFFPARQFFPPAILGVLPSTF